MKRPRNVIKISDHAKIIYGTKGNAALLAHLRNPTLLEASRLLLDKLDASYTSVEAFCFSGELAVLRAAIEREERR